jgi:aminoglycoside 6'-N-acetyltransferase
MQELVGTGNGTGTEVVYVVEADGVVAGAIQFAEEDDPDYRHAALDVYLAERFQGRGLGAEAVALLAAHLIDERGHHRLTIDPAVANVAAIRAYERVGFRRVGVMRRYERGPDGEWHDGLLMDLLADELRRELLTPANRERGLRPPPTD